MNENSNSLRNHNTIVESAAEENEEIGKLNLPVNDRDHIQGPRTASVNLVEYGDYECPYTGQAYPIVKEIQKRLGDKLLFVFRNFPLREIHPHAQHAAEGSRSWTHRESSGTCTIICLNINKHLMTTTY